jgi:3-hydroxybutyryl-CoA dehydrogenase
MLQNRVAIIGAGTMGQGITLIFSQYGAEVSIVDNDSDILKKGILSISNNFDKLIKKGIITEKEKIDALERINPIKLIENIPKDVDLVIEAISEDKLAKISLFKKLDCIINHNCIFASNTSSISITELSVSSRPDRFIGMHFMNPVPLMKLVEIIKGYLTSPETLSEILKITSELGKIPVVVNDSPGFVSNRILMSMINEAIFTLYEGVASPEDIDTIMKLGMNHPMGPLTLADFIGLDVCLSIMEVIYDGFKDSKYRPCPLLKKMVVSGKLGRKTGSGFFTY